MWRTAALPAPDVRALGVFTEVRERLDIYEFEVGIGILPSSGTGNQDPIRLRVRRPKENYTLVGASRREIIEDLITQLNNQLAVEALEGR